MSDLKNIYVFLALIMFIHEAACESSITSDLCTAIGERFTLQLQLMYSNPLSITWKRSDKLFGMNSYPNGSACRIEDTTVYNLTRYTFTCESNEFIMHIENISNDDLNKSWYVTVYGDKQTYSADVRSCAPVSFVNMTKPSDDTIDVEEGVQKIFKCETSAAWPQANVTWYKREPNTTDEDIINGGITAEYNRTDENLYITHSSLAYNITRKEQSFRIFCKANNTVKTSVVSAKQPQLNILYVPNHIIPVIEGYGNSFTLIEHSILNITCAIDGGNPRPTLAWLCNDGAVTEENSGTETKVRVVWRAERNKDGLCTCISYHPLVSTNESDTVNIEILYPPTKPSLSINGENRNGTITVTNNTSVDVHCLSTSKPPPTFTWLPQNINNNSDTYLLLIDKNTSVRCTASNTMTDSSGIATISSDIFLHILYGPTTPILSCSSQNSQGDIIGPRIDVIQGDNLTLTCYADAHPEPSYTWNGKDGETVTISNVEHDNMMYNCVASSLLNPDVGQQHRINSSSIVQINKLYGPRTPPTLTYRLQGVENIIRSTPFNVVEYSSFSITCDNSNSKPMSTYQWIGQIKSDNGVLDVTAIKRPKTFGLDGKSYYSSTCMARNTMVNTCGDQRTETGTWNETKRVNVLFPASLDSEHDRTVLEGNTFNLTAHVRNHGSPRETYKWFYKKAQSSSKVELASNLTHTIRNISRISAGFYTIEATNQIVPTGLPKYNATVNQTFYLDVFYKTSIASFSIDGEESNATVDESATVALLCTVDSNPESDIHLHAITYIGESQIAQSKQRDILEYKLQNATCFHTGIYLCKAGNNYTSPQAERRKHLFVRCTPRPRYSVKQNSTVHSALGESVTLKMTVIAFPIPSPEQFTWVKITGQNEHLITSQSNTNITTVDLHTQLTIKQLNQADLGQYKLTIQYSDNDNSYMHYFYIAPNDKPQMPTEFTHIKAHLSETTAYFEWTPGFDGGLPQTFYILYKTHTDSSWSHKRVAGDNTTLTELNPNTLYYIKIYANNRLGNSSESSTLNFTTKIRLNEKTQVSATTVIGAAVSGGSAIVIVAVVIVVILVRRNSKTGQKSDQVRQQLYNDGNIYDADGMEANVAYESAESLEIQHMHASSDVYAQVDKSKKNTNTSRDNTYAVVDKNRKTVAVELGEGDVYAMPKKTKKANKRVKKSKDKKQKRQDVYENSNELAVYNNTDIISDAAENIYEDPLGNTPPMRNKDGLVYAELSFDNNNKGQKKLVIRGLENATDYSEVDFSKKAQPLPENDGEGDIA